MKFVPINRHLLVEPLAVSGDEEEAKILLPEDYSKPKAPFAVVRLISASSEANSGRNSYHWEPGKKLVVNANMLEEISVEKQVFHVILENYVVGVLN